MQIVSRLIKTFRPSHYDLSLTLLRQERKFRGKVALLGQLDADSKQITLHAKDLTILTATIDDTAVSHTLGDNDELTLLSESILKDGNHIINLTFEGAITDPMHGLYPSYYEEDGVKKELLATQFESHHAREVFPCIDEPEAKATFDLTLVTEENIAVLGNMPVKHQEAVDSQLKTTFETTPRMSTYLLAFVAGDLQKVTATSKSGVEVNIWSTKAHSRDSLAFSLETATKAIDFLSEYFDTPYPLPKADHVALPDFSAGAMENWGLITYREICLLVDPKTTSTSVKQYAAIVIVHELSHQWFGNLVTMKWWDDLWLNESFASLMEYIGVDHLFPEWKIWLNFTTSESLYALRRDALPGVQAVRTDVNHPDEISTLFDPAIVYAKGARTLRMLRSYVGDTAFQNGLKHYFKTHAYSNTEGNDLWEAIGKASGKDIREFMHAWLDQSGFPIVKVETEGEAVHVSQKQFLIGEPSPAQKLWPIPLHANQADFPQLFDTSTLATTYHPEDYLKLNLEDTAHYVTKYDETLRQKLLTAIIDGKLSPVDRLQILHEATLLPRGNEGESSTLVELLTAYKNEITEPVWDIIALAIGDLKRFVEEDPVAEKSLRRLSKTLAQALYEKLGWTPKANEPETDALLRATIIGCMVYSEDRAIIDKALEYFTAHRHDISAINSDLRSIVLSVAVRYAEDKDTIVNELIETYQHTASSDLQSDVCGALCSTRDTRVAEKLLDLMKDTKIIRPQDTSRWYVLLLRNKYSRQLAWQWVQNNWDWIVETFGGDKSYDNFPRYAGSILIGNDYLKEYETFFTPLKKEPALARAIEVGIAEIKGKTIWHERDRDAVCQTLSTLQ